MSRMKNSCGLFTNIAPLYSKPLWLKLSSSVNVVYYFFTSPTGFSGIRVINVKESILLNNKTGFNWYFLKNLYIGNILVYQLGAAYKCLKTDFDAYIFNGEVQCLSNWIASLICRFKRKPVLFWGHGFYGNESWIKGYIRKLFYRLADYHLIYGKRSAELMVGSGFSPDKIYTVYNSLDFELHKKLYVSRDINILEKTKIELFPRNSDLPVAIFIGRLTREKKIPYLLKAIHMCKSRGHSINCLIVGGGIDSDSLKILSKSLDIEELVFFFGPSYEEEINANLIMISDCCVSPGNIGLTAIHSMSLGTPVITHGNLANQGPEAEAIIENKTGIFFEENNILSLSLSIEHMIYNLKKSSMESYCIEQIEKFWNPNKQASVFNEAVLKAINSKN